MAEQIVYIESNGDHNSLTASPYKYLGGTGLYEWNVESIYTELPYNIGIHRSYQWHPRKIILDLFVSGDNYYTVQKNIQELFACFLPDIEANETGTLRVMTENNEIYELAVAPNMPRVTKIWNKGATVSLTLIAPEHHFSQLPEGEVSGVFAGASSVTVDFTNSGDLEAWPIFTITGIVSRPKITYPDNTYIQVASATAASADLLTIYTKPTDLRIIYQPGGGASINWTGYAGSVSTFSRLPLGADSITLSASSGTASLTMTWQNLKAGIA